MTNLERAKQGERLKVKLTGDGAIQGVYGNDFLLPCASQENQVMWINDQIDLAVTHAIDDTPEPELWRDLETMEAYKEGDRIAIHEHAWTLITKDHCFIGVQRSVTDPIAQRRIRKEDIK